MQRVILRSLSRSRLLPSPSSSFAIASVRSSQLSLPRPNNQYHQHQHHHRRQHSTKADAGSSQRAGNWKFVLLASSAALSWYFLQSDLDVAVAAGADSAYSDLAYVLCQAASDGDVERILALIKASKDPHQLVNTRHRGGWTALQVAAAHGQTECLRMLLEYGADVNATDMYNHHRPDIVRRQFHPSVKLDANCQGMTALHYAVAFRNVSCASELLIHGADPSAKNSFGQSPESMIEWYKGQPLEQELRKAFEEAGEERKKKEKEERLKFPLEAKLKSQMVGQLMPIYAVSGAIRRRDNGWYDETKPLVFLFLGSSGVGKTMLAKTLAEEVMKTRHKGDKNYEKNGFIRIDMSEYSSKHEVSRLIGSPPGYVGHEEGGQLTTKLAQCPEAVVLLDEVEKAHPDVLTLMLQVFDEGRLTDGRGNTINCPKAIFIMTSNLVQDEIREAAEDKAYHLRPESEDPHEMEAKVAVDTQEFLRKTVHPILKRHFKRDEFLGRINDMLIFHPFSMHDLRVIVNMELSKWASKANQRHKIAIKWSDKVVDSLTHGFDERYGFRSIKYEVEKRVVNILARAHERDEIISNSEVTLDLSEDGRVIIKDVHPLGPITPVSSSSSPSSTQQGGLKSLWNKLAS